MLYLGNGVVLFYRWNIGVNLVMAKTIIVVLIILWFLGYNPIAGINIPNIPLFSINQHQITLWNVLILIAISMAIEILPGPLQKIASFLLLLWVLSTLGIFAIAGLSNIIVLLIIIGLVMSLFK